jgi:hypothetical protein
MDMGDLADVWPGLRHADRSSDPVRRLDVGDAEHVFRIGICLVEQEVGAPVRQNGQHRELLSHRPERRAVSAGDDAGEQVDLGVELHPPQLFDIGVGAGRLVRGDRLDLALAEEAALGVDLLRCHRVALERRLAEHRRGARQEGHVADLERRIGNLALCGFLGCLEDPGAANQTGAGDSRSSDGHAQCVEKATTTCG